jgi:hypothetical protein
MNELITIQRRHIEKRRGSSRQFCGGAWQMRRKRVECPGVGAGRASTGTINCVIDRDFRVWLVGELGTIVSSSVADAFSNKRAIDIACGR